MSHQGILYQWSAELKRRLTQLSTPQALELALWSIGMVLARRATLTAVAVALTPWLGSSFNTLRQHLRDWYLPAKVKCGKKRVALEPQQSFVDLAAWVVSLLSGSKIAVALDASTAKDRLTVLCVSILIHGGAVPIAWRILPGNEPEHWNAHWLELLDRMDGAFGADRFVIVLTDRGLWSPSLFQAIRRHGWHPLMRIQAEGAQGEARYFQAVGQSWRPLSSLTPRRGHERWMEGRAFKKHALPCRLIVFFGQASQEPWYLLTDLAVDQGGWYGFRFWIEHQFRQIKSDGWNWERSRMTDCARAERLWLAYAVSLLWTLSFGSHAEEENLFEENLFEDQWLNSHREKHLAQHDQNSRNEKHGAPRSARMISLFQKGLAILASVIEQGRALRCPKFAIYRWPEEAQVNNTS